MIVITAPTGQIGGQVVENLLDDPDISAGRHGVRVIVRDPLRLPDRVVRSVEIVPGAHDDPDVLDTAFADADAVFWLVPPNAQTESVDGHYENFTRPACEAFLRHGVGRVVGVSSMGRGFSKDAGLLSAALRMDDMITATGVAYRALRMPFFMENLLHQIGPINEAGAFFLPNAADRPLRLVATRDVARAASRLLLDESWSGQHDVIVTSPDQHTPEGMAHVMSEVLGRRISFRSVDDADFTAMMMQRGTTAAWTRGMVEMAVAQDAGIYQLEEPAQESTTTFARWCEDVLAPAVMTTSHAS